MTAFAASVDCDGLWTVRQTHPSSFPSSRYTLDGVAYFDADFPLVLNHRPSSTITADFYDAFGRRVAGGTYTIAFADLPTCSTTTTRPTPSSTSSPTTSAPVASTAPPTTARALVPPPTTIAAQTTTQAPIRPPSLPATGGPVAPLVAGGLVIAVLGVIAVRRARRRPAPLTVGELVDREQRAAELAAERRAGYVRTYTARERADLTGAPELDELDRWLP